MKTIYQALVAFLVVLVCAAWTCQAFSLQADLARREAAADALAEMTDQEIYNMLVNLANGVSKRGTVKHLGLANVDNWRMMKNVNKLRNLLSGGKRSEQQLDADK
ncbi:uncharacterized protein [Diadema setosum]|uniref:uncharacterized protein n=1 Tax=Diadema antillarum TaxID=105358 RepID=UPI003A8C6ED3